MKNGSHYSPEKKSVVYRMKNCIFVLFFNQKKVKVILNVYFGEMLQKKTKKKV